MEIGVKFMRKIWLSLLICLVLAACNGKKREKELQTEIDDLKNKNLELSAKVAELRAQLARGDNSLTLDGEKAPAPTAAVTPPPPPVENPENPQPTKPEKTPEKTPEAKGVYALQAGAFGSAANAQVAKDKIAKAGIRVSVHQDKKLFFVETGPYKSEEAAAADKKKLIGLGFKPIPKKK